MNNRILTIIDLLKTLTLLEVNSLILEIEKIFDVKISSLINTLAINNLPQVTNVVENIEEKTTYNVVLIEFPADKKIAVLKSIRSITGLGLKESKDIVDNIPKIVKAGLSKDEAENLKKELELVNAKVRIE